MRPLLRNALALCGLVLALGSGLVTLDYIDELHRQIEGLVAEARSEPPNAARVPDPAEPPRDAEAEERLATAQAETARAESLLSEAVAGRDRAAAEGDARARAQSRDIETLRRTNGDLRESLSAQARRLAVLEQSLVRAEAAARTEDRTAAPRPPDRQAEAADDLRRRLAELQTAYAALEERLARTRADADALRARSDSLGDLGADAARIGALRRALSRLPAFTNAPPLSAGVPQPTLPPKSRGGDDRTGESLRPAPPVRRPVSPPKPALAASVPAPPPMRAVRATRTAQRPFSLPPELRPIGR